jgi:hypothetical protein
LSKPHQNCFNPQFIISFFINSSSTDANFDSGGNALVCLLPRADHMMEYQLPRWVAKPEKMRARACPPAFFDELI